MSLRLLGSLLNDTCATPVIVVVVGGIVLYKIAKRGSENQAATEVEVMKVDDELQNLLSQFFGSDDYIVTKY